MKLPQHIIDEGTALIRANKLDEFKAFLEREAPGFTRGVLFSRIERRSILGELDGYSHAAKLWQECAENYVSPDGVMFLWEPL